MYVNNELYHHGILGMRWGVRRYQPYGEGGYNPKHEGKYVGKNYRNQKRELKKRLNATIKSNEERYINKLSEVPKHSKEADDLDGQSWIDNQNARRQYKKDLMALKDKRDKELGRTKSDKQKIKDRYKTNRMNIDARFEKEWQKMDPNDADEFDKVTDKYTEDIRNNKNKYKKELKDLKQREYDEKNPKPTHEQLLNSTNAKMLYEHRSELSDAELRNRLNRIQMETQLENFSRSDNKYIRLGEDIIREIAKDRTKMHINYHLDNVDPLTKAKVRRDVDTKLYRAAYTENQIEKRKRRG